MKLQSNINSQDMNQSILYTGITLNQIQKLKSKMLAIDNKKRSAEFVR